MVHDTSSSHLQHIASCYYYEASDEDNSSDIMKRPLITTAMSSSNVSLETEDQTRQEQQSKRLVWQAFFLGSAIGFVLQVVVVATYYTIFKIWGQHPTFSASYFILVLLSQVDTVICIGISLTFVYSMTKSGSLYMRKKLDQDHVDTPAGANSIWTARMLCVVGIYLLVGVSVGSCSFWTIVDLRMGMVMVVPLLTPWLMTAVVDFSFFYIMIKCFDWGHGKGGDEQEEEEEEEDDSFSDV
jgi:hypothetical protein